MLPDLLNNKEDFKILLIEDSIEQTGRGLLKAFLQKLSHKVDEVHYLSYDFPPDCVTETLDPAVLSRVVSYDMFSDAHGWIGQSTLDSDLPSRLTEKLNQGIENIAVVLDSLSPLLIHRQPQVTCQTLNTLAYRSIRKGVKVKYVVSLVHGDLHDPHTLAMVEHTATTLIKITKSDHPQFTGISHVTQKRGSGKIIKKAEYFTLDSNCLLSHSQEVSAMKAEEIRSVVSKEPDPTANLTFNLRLTSDEKEARSQVKLPYTYQENRKEQLLKNSQETGKIFYHPDKEDDFDEDDPDDDLDI